MKQKIYTEEGDAVGEYETKPKTWEATIAMIVRGVYLNAKLAPEKDTQVYLEAEKEIAKVIASQIEKTRREAYEQGIMEYQLSSRGIHEVAARKYEEKGFKAGLERAIELVPEKCRHVESNRPLTDRAMDHDQGFEDCKEQMLENLKKEMEK
jgi:hypothetical protein